MKYNSRHPNSGWGRGVQCGQRRDQLRTTQMRDLRSIDARCEDPSDLGSMLPASRISVVRSCSSKANYAALVANVPPAVNDDGLTRDIIRADQVQHGLGDVFGAANPT